MKKIALALLAISAMSFVACSDPPPPPPPPEPVKPVEPPPPPPPPAVVIPDYNPQGDFADLKKGAAAGIDDKNAMAKATETETALNAAIATLEAAKKK